MYVKYVLVNIRSQPPQPPPLQPIVVEEPFKQWGLDVIGEIFCHSSKKH